MANKDHRRTYQKRNERARALGFVNYSELRKTGGVRQVTRQSRRDLDRLPPKAREVRNLSIEAVASMRREGLSLQRAAAEFGVPPESIRIWARAGLFPDGKPRPADRMLRTVVIVSDGQQRSVDLRGSRQASRVGAYWNAVGRFLDTGDASMLKPFEGKRVGGFLLETDPDVLEDLALRSQLGFEDIYSLGG